MKPIHWLRNNKLATFFLSIIYFCLVILPHEWVGVRVTRIFRGMPRARYDLIILILCLILLLFLFALTFKRIKNHEERNKLIFYFLFTMVCMILTNSYLFTVNVESIHYVQYAIATFLLFALIENYFVVLFVAFLIGVFDESYQYFYLAYDLIGYFDINDIITNLLGAAFGLLLLKTFKVTETNTKKGVYKKAVILPLILIVISMVIVLQTNFLSVFPSDDKYVLFQKIPEGFWSKTPKPVSVFHIVQAHEGLTILTILFTVYFFCFQTKTEETN